MSNTELLIKEIETLPADYTARILDFIEFLKNTAPRRTVSSDFPVAYSPEEALRVSALRSAARRANPALNTMEKYKGCLKDSANFGRDGMEIQRELRNEWE
ncbi:MAG: DUF2281 domain-containing protein [Spirochaetaceae bacterium]|jgi:hypothetical protein|nr:DUF2281 domain-containing protein [Spirochaetaceae bacterium]